MHKVHKESVAVRHLPAKMAPPHVSICTEQTNWCYSSVSTTDRH